MHSELQHGPLGKRDGRALPPAEIVEAFARHVPGAIYIYRRYPDGHACVDYISDGIVDIYGYTPDELYADVELGHARIHPDDRPVFEASVARCFDSHAPWRCEYRVVLPEQGVRHVSAAATLEPQPDGSVIWIGHLIDVTEFAVARHRLQEEITRAHRAAVAANEAKSTFVAHVSHELRTPLHGILGLAELIAADEAVPAPVRHQAGQIHRAGQHLVRLIADIIDLSAIEAGRLTLSIEPVALASVVDEARRMAAPVAHENGIALEIDPRLQGDYRVLADGTRLAQVLLNLLGNGIKYNRPHGRVRVGLLAVTPESIRLGVADTGRGLREDEIARLFDPFDRLGREMGRVEGSGIGLLIARNLITAMGGTLGVESEPGAGSTFWLELPRTTTSLAAPATPAAAAEHAAPRPWAPIDLRVLVAEDNPLGREVFAQQLRKLACTAEFAEDGAAAWHRWRAAKHDVVITDVHMPGVNGYELTERIRAAEIGQHGQATYIIGASANAMKQAAQEAIARGMDDYVTKPLALAGLRDALARAAQRRRDAVFTAHAADTRDGRGAPSAPPVADDGDASATLAGPRQGGAVVELPPALAAVLDLTLLEELADGDTAQLDEFLALFLASAEASIAALRDGAHGGDLAGVERAAHKLKSSARTIGACHLGDLCAAAEVVAARRDATALDNLLPNIVGEFTTIRAALAAHLRC